MTSFRSAGVWIKIKTNENTSEMNPKKSFIQSFMCSNTQMETERKRRVRVSAEPEEREGRVDIRQETSSPQLQHDLTQSDPCVCVCVCVCVLMERGTTVELL